MRCIGYSPGVSGVSGLLDTIMQTTKVNYQILLDNTLRQIEEQGSLPRLLLHSCCAPCSSYVLEYLSRFFEITVFYYNPNIESEAEFEKRFREVERLVAEMPMEHPVTVIRGKYEPERFYAEVARGYEHVPEGQERCFRCYRQRLTEAAQLAAEGRYDYFTTTLSISPLKNAQVLNAIGKELAKTYEVGYLFSDFKKRGGYQRSIELSRIYSLYRQNYCGCVYSKREQEERAARGELGGCAACAARAQCADSEIRM